MVVRVNRSCLNNLVGLGTMRFNDNGMRIRRKVIKKNSRVVHIGSVNVRELRECVLSGTNMTTGHLDIFLAKMVSLSPLISFFPLCFLYIVAVTGEEGEIDEFARVRIVKSMGEREDCSREQRSCG